MAKFDWGFEIDNKATAQAEGFVQVTCKRTNTMAQFAYMGNHPSVKDGSKKWGDVLWCDMAPAREADAETFLHTMGWI